MASNLPLLFLRPLGPPRLSTLHNFLPRISSCNVSTFRSTTSTPQTLKQLRPSRPTTSAQPPKRSNPSNPSKYARVFNPDLFPPAPKYDPSIPLPYRVTRTPSNNLAIYTMAKRGGNMKLTKLRRIEGDVNVLREDLEKYLRVDPKECVINRLTGQIIVKGHKKEQIEKFLIERQF